MRQVSVSLEPELLALVQKRATEQQRSISNFIGQLLRVTIEQSSEEELFRKMNPALTNGLLKMGVPLIRK